jgi:2,3-bisphosphoglycerate-independent phosphoglycerate mutase
VEALTRVDRLARALVAGLGEGDSLVVASDHGNVEDLGNRNHTRNPVPVLAFGPAAGFLGTVADLTGIAPVLRAVAGR